MDIKERYIATLLGSALGDSLGMPVEGWKKQQIEKYMGRVTTLIDPVIIRDQQGQEVNQDEFGKLKYWTRNLKLGDVTDDTILTLAIAESLINNGFDLEDSAERQLQAYQATLNENNKSNHAFGGSTITAFKQLTKGIPPSHSGLNTGIGSGPPMKMSPIGIYMHATKEPKKGLRFAEQVSKITHLDPSAVTAGIVQANAVYHLLNNINKKDFIKMLEQTSKKYEETLTKEFRLIPKGNLASRIEWISKNRDSTTQEAYDHLGCSSLAFECYPFTLFMFQKYWNNPIEGLIKTVNHGGDCDTTGAMYGALAGAKKGMIFPDDWKNKLKGLDKIINLGEELHNLRK